MERRGLRVEIDENEVARNIGFFDSLYATALTYSYGEEGGNLDDGSESVRMSIPFAGHTLQRVRRKPTQPEADERAINGFFEMIGKADSNKGA
jgi:hypothetical protein